ncbi:nucleotide sugar dehydrogenase [Exiguobacterium aestuarii]|uniref:Nucleotide sugar dehydrogenase n=1 Tax=Exiguobacterium aestuarii TaxID=273527 RepID=A0ABW2PKG1_9BACL|nr:MULTISPECIES: nucleotide sugar dehydrogenase [Exiguobacterium]MCT4785120.1 nucleotide sugar dehydrogenase [Exiguobacterium aestuarii]
MNTQVVHKDLYQQIVTKQANISLIGLGYVGMPIAVAFAKKINVIGFDISSEKVELYKNGIDPTKEVGNDAIKQTTVEFTSNEEDLQKAKFHIVAVPTPVNADHTPDLRPIQGASRTLGKNLTKGSIVVYESTVYPGVTEDICVPILEEESGLKCGVDFKVGYSPERINPGDTVHRLETIIKVVSGMDEESLDIIAKVYELVVDAGVYKAESIKVAEAAKVIENSQRDINIAFMNELSIIFNKMNIDTKAVLKAAGTKWNFLNFSPGLVGGHCIGVDPYYLTYKAEQLGYRSQIILSGRRINDDMGKYVVENLIKNLIKANVPVADAKVAILGFTFKEDCPDTRNTRVIDIVEELKEYGITPVIADPVADAEEAHHEYGIIFDSMEDVQDMDAVILAVAHKEFMELSNEKISKWFNPTNQKKVLLDIKGVLNRQDYETKEYKYWRL